MALPLPVPPQADGSVAAVRRFNRFYTRQIGVLQEGLLGSRFSLTEVRVLYELAHHHGVTATELCAALNLDAGYLSRILRKFEKRGWVHRRPSASDRRQNLLVLTNKGAAEFLPLEERSNQLVRRMLGEMSLEAQQQLIRSMEEIERVLSPPQESAQPYLLRSHQPGDMGWVVYRHGVLYSQEYLSLIHISEPTRPY